MAVAREGFRRGSIRGQIRHKFLLSTSHTYSAVCNGEFQYFALRCRFDTVEGAR
jgi:hypothetical protein